MPSPIGHALAGIAAGWIIAPSGSRGSPAVLRAAVFGIAAASADVDLLFRAHSGPTHGLGAALVAGAIAWMFMARRETPDARRIACAIAAAYASHTLLDWLGTDTAPPIGIMALWPFSRAYYESPLHVFMAISRHYWLPEFWIGNLRALARELAILLPIVGIVLLGRSRVGRGLRSPPSDAV